MEREGLGLRLGLDNNIKNDCDSINHHEIMLQLSSDNENGNGDRNKDRDGDGDWEWGLGLGTGNHYRLLLYCQAQVQDLIPLSPFSHLSPSFLSGLFWISLSWSLK